MKKVFAQLLLQHKSVPSLFRYNCQNFQKAASNIVVRYSAKTGNPAAFTKTCLCASLLPFPVVKAWSVWNKKDSDDGTMEKFAKSLRINKKGVVDKALVEAIYKADELYKNGEPSDYQEIFTILNDHRDKNEPELQWRLARIIYNLAKKVQNTQEKARMTEEAFELVTKALEMDEGNFAVHKWTAILLNEVSILKGLKEQITQSVNVKKHIMRAIELNPQDATSHYMLGNWCFSVAEVPWYQKKVAATLFATPPESTYTEALEHFQNAEKLDPNFYSMNHLMLAKIYIQLGELNNAAKYLKFLESRKVKTDDDFMAKMEAIDLIKKYFKTERDFNVAATADIEVVSQ